MTTHTVEASDKVDSMLQPWLAPISEAAPCGPNPRYSPSFEAIRAEIGKLEDPAAGQVQWALLVRMCDEALQKEAKDLAVASYLAMGWVNVEGFAGLERGATLLAALVDRYWATMYPEVSRIRARVNAVTWYVDQLKQWLAHRESAGETMVAGLDAGRVESCLTAYQRFSEIARARFADSAPALRGPEESLRRLLESARTTQPSSSTTSAGSGSSAAEVDSQAPSSGRGDEPQTAPPPAATSPAPTVSVQTMPAVSTLSVEAGVVSTDAVDQFLRQASRNLLTAVESLRSGRENDPKVIRYWMNALYMSLHALPDSSSVPPPPAALLSQLQGTVTAPSRAALGQAYWTLERHRFALDAHHVLNQLLARLGPEWDAVREAHHQELCGLLQRFPELPGLCFSDGSPCASEATRRWFAEELRASQPTAAVGSDAVSRGFVSSQDLAGSVQVDRGPAPHAPAQTGLAIEAMASAAELAQQGKVEQALSVLQRACHHASDGAERFELRLAAAELCAKANFMQLAAPLFAELVAVIRQHHLERWQKVLASRTLFGFYQCLTSLESNKDPSAAAQGVVHAISVDKHQLYVELCQLDPVMALQLAPHPSATPRAGSRAGTRTTATP